MSEQTGTRIDPLPDKEFENFKNGDIVPVPRYYGTFTWIFPESWAPGSTGETDE